MQKLSFNELLKTAFSDTKNHFFVLFGLILMVFLGSFIMELIVQALAQLIPAIGFVFKIGSYILQAYVTLGLVNLCLLIVRGHEYETKDLLVPFSTVIRYLGVVFIISFVVVVLMLPFAFSLNWTGSITDFMNMEDGFKLPFDLTTTSYVLLPITFLVVFYLLIRVLFYNYLIVESDFSINDIITESIKLTKGKVGFLTSLMLIVMLLNVLGVLLLLVGILFTIPMSYLLITRVYTIFADEMYPDVAAANLQSGVENE